MASVLNSTVDKRQDLRLLGFALSARDPLGRMEEAGFWLEAYRQSLPNDAVRVFEVVDQIDELVQGHRLSLTREYLESGGRMQTYREHRIWNALVRFARELADGYESCLRMFQAKVPGADALMTRVPVIAARAMRAHTLELRWALLRYSALDALVWSRMGVLYALADRGDFATLRLKVYPAMSGDSTVRREYLRALILSVSGMGNLLPPAQLIAERVVASVAEFFLLHRKPAGGCYFAVDLRAARAPYRVTEGLEPTRGRRFFGPGDADVMVHGFIGQTQSGVVPAEVRLARDTAPVEVAAVLRHLARQWGEKPPARAEARHRVLTTMHVAHGFERVLDAIATEAGDPLVDELTEAWTVENESNGGFGAVLPIRAQDWLAVGTLVAAKPTWPSSWSVGVIRRVSARNPLHRSVGVQVLARGGVAVRLVAQPAQRFELPVEGILLPVEEQTSLQGGEVAIVLPRGRTAQLESCEMRVHDKAYVLHRRRITDHGEDFEIARFADPRRVGGYPEELGPPRTPRTPRTNRQAFKRAIGWRSRFGSHALSTNRSCV